MSAHLLQLRILCKIRNLPSTSAVLYLAVKYASSPYLLSWNILLLLISLGIPLTAENKYGSFLVLVFEGSLALLLVKLFQRALEINLPVHVRDCIFLNLRKLLVTKDVLKKG